MATEHFLCDFRNYSVAGSKNLTFLPARYDFFTAAICFFPWSVGFGNWSDRKFA